MKYNLDEIRLFSYTSGTVKRSTSCRHVNSVHATIYSTAYQLSIMITLKLSRVGKKKQPTFRLIVTEKGRDPWGKALEILGTKNPRTKETKLNVERISYWISKGAQMTKTVHNLLIDEKIISGEKEKTFSITKRRAVKIAAAKAESEKKVAPKEEIAAPAEEPKVE